MSAIRESSPRDRERDRFRQQLDALSPVLTVTIARRTQTQERWWELYASCFGDERTLSKDEFSHLTTAIFDTIANVLMPGDIKGFEGGVQRRWRMLARRVPFAESMVMVHLFEESVLSTVVGLENDLAACRLFHQCVYQCVPLIADAYLQAGVAETLERPPLESQLVNGMFHGLVGNSAPMRNLYRRIEAVGRSGSTALIFGETGTGKELVARAIHECGPRPDAPFVAINCAALPGQLIESELFGHVRGSFTGADSDALGLFRAADGGTLFLDEITEMGAAAQARLLRALQERTIRPVGCLKELPVRVWIIASTNRDPQEAIKHGLLREDLYYRLNVALLHVAPLRERPDDIEALVWHFIETLGATLAREIPVTDVSVQAMEAMRSYAWPGNVRELANAIGSALTFSRSDTVRLDDLPEAISGRPVESPARHPAKVMSISDAERQLVIRSLEANDGNISASARSLGISRKKLYARILRYGVSY